MDNELMGKYAAKLLSAVADSGKGLRHLAELGGEMLGNPVAITDKSWKALAITADTDIPDDPHWNELVTGGYISAQSVVADIRDKLADKLEQSCVPFKWQSPEMKYPRMLGKVPVNGRLAATISVIEYERPFRDGDAELLALLCDAVAADLQKSDFRQFTRGIMYEELVGNLLGGTLTDPDIIEERVKILGIGLKKNIYVFVFDITCYDPGRYSVTYMRDVLEKMISGGQALVYDGKIVITASFTRARDIFKTELQRLGEFLKTHNIRCGISRRCEKLHELRFYYEQALDARRIGTYVEPDRHIYPYGDYAVYHIAEICSESGKSKVFRHPALGALMAYDEEYGTSFTASLYAYLRHFRSVSKAAASLNLHRNTFVYHLRRIGEIMEIDLSDYKTTQLVELSFTMLEYEKKLSFRRGES